MDPPDPLPTTQLETAAPSTKEVNEAVKLEPKDETPPAEEEEEDQQQSTSTTTPADSTSDTKPPEPPPVARSARTVCRFGVKCYRKNGSHRDEEAHPGDPDYTMPDYPEPPPHTPQCPYGSTCYRRNPQHFQQFSHSGSPSALPTHAPPPAKRRRMQPRYSSDSDDSEDGADEMADFLDDHSDDEDPYGVSDEDDMYDPDGDLDSSY